MMKWISVNDYYPPFSASRNKNMALEIVAPYVFVYYPEWDEVDVAYYMTDSRTWHQAYGDTPGGNLITDKISHWAEYNTPENK